VKEEMMKRVLLLAAALVLAGTVPAWTADQGKARDMNQGRLQAETKASEQAVFSRISDWFATLGKSGAEKEKILTERRVKRLEARQEKKLRKEDQENKEKIKAATDEAKKNLNKMLEEGRKQDREMLREQTQSRDMQRSQQQTRQMDQTMHGAGMSHSGGRP
jgi:hypothetical protein